jgi:hypothetical protein
MTKSQLRRCGGCGVAVPAGRARMENWVCFEAKTEGKPDEWYCFQCALAELGLVRSQK